MREEDGRKGGEGGNGEGRSIVEKGQGGRAASNMGRMGVDRMREEEGR
jgi:hypothetical protein